MTEAQGPTFRLAAVANVYVDLPTPTPTVVLRETEESKRQLTISVGLPEGVALAHAFFGRESPRPLTHELFTTVLQLSGVELLAVRIVARRGQTYFAEMEIGGRAGNHVLSCRPSDALVLALRQTIPAPLLVDDRLFEWPGDVAPWGDPPEG